MAIVDDQFAIVTMKASGTYAGQIRAIVVTKATVEALNSDASVLQTFTIDPRINVRTETLVTVEKIDTHATVEALKDRRMNG